MSTNDEIREALERLVKAETKIIKGFPDDEAYASAAYEYGKALDHARSVLQRTAQKHPAVSAWWKYREAATAKGQNAWQDYLFLAGWKEGMLAARGYINLHTTKLDIIDAMTKAAAECPETT